MGRIRRLAGKEKAPGSQSGGFNRFPFWLSRLVEGRISEQASSGTASSRTSNPCTAQRAAIPKVTQGISGQLEMSDCFVYFGRDVLHRRPGVCPRPGGCLPGRHELGGYLRIFRQLDLIARDRRAVLHGECVVAEIRRLLELFDFKIFGKLRGDLFGIVAPAGRR